MPYYVMMIALCCACYFWLYVLACGMGRMRLHIWLWLYVLVCGMGHILSHIWIWYMCLSMWYGTHAIAYMHWLVLWLLIGVHDYMTIYLPGVHDWMPVCLLWHECALCCHLPYEYLFDMHEWIHQCYLNCDNYRLMHENTIPWTAKWIYGQWMACDKFSHYVMNAQTAAGVWFRRCSMVAPFGYT